MLLFFCMDNFFNFKQNNNTTPVAEQYGDMKENYKKIFIEAAESIRREIDKFKPENPCTLCSVKNCKIENKDVFADYPVGCKYRDWQKQVLSFLHGEYRQKMKNSYRIMMEEKSCCECIQCGNCCRLAVSEYSYQQLKQRANKGDKFSQDFVSVFVPFETVEDARNANPDYFNLLDNLLEEQKIYYYYCPKLVDNKCSDYENRPDICKVFPNNPLQMLPSTCSFNEWKNKISKYAMFLKAKTDIIEFYNTKLG